MFLWLLIGLILGAALILVATRIKLKWYEWVLGTLAVIMLVFAVQNFTASQLEYEPRAATYMLLIFGLTGVVLGVITLVLAWMRSRKQATPEGAPETA